MNRLLALDLARGFTVLFIPAVHCMLLYGSTEVHQTWVAQVFSFIAEWPGAQLLMFLMGISMSFSKRSSSYYFKKGFIVLAAGYLLNFFKFVLPELIGILPRGFVHDLHIYHERQVWLQLLLTGDIFQFAGIAILIIAIVKKIYYGSIISVFLGYVILLFSPIGWDLEHSNFFADHFLNLLGGRPDEVFFPLLPWLSYPLFGLAVGRYLQLPFASVSALFIGGCVFMIAILLTRLTPFHFPETSFFRAYPDTTLMHLGFVIAWVCMWFGIVAVFSRNIGKQPTYRFVFNGREWEPITLFVTEKIEREDQMRKHVLCRLLCFCSRHISVIYISQWILIFWMLPVFGYQELGLGATIVVCVLMTVLVHGFVWSLRAISRHEGH